MKRVLRRAVRVAAKAVLGLIAAAFMLFWALRLGGSVASERARREAVARFWAHRAAFEQALFASQQSQQLWGNKRIDVPQALRDVDVEGIYVSEGYIRFSFERGVSPFIGQGIFYIRDGDSVEDFFTLYPIDGEWVYYQYSSI